MIKRLSAFIISAAVSVYLILPSFAEDGKDYIKWIDFDVTAQALRDTASVDCESHGSENEYSWIDLLSVLAVKYGGDFSRYRKADLDEICDRLASGYDYTEIVSNEKLYNYYLDAYGAVLGGMLGSFRDFTTDENGNVTELLCSIDIETGNGMPSDGRKVKGNIHWLSRDTAVPFTVHQFDNIFNKENVATLLEDDNFDEFINPESLIVFPTAYGEPALADAKLDEKFQFVRMGYFTRDSKNENVFNRTAPLKSSFKPE